MFLVLDPLPKKFSKFIRECWDSYYLIIKIPIKYKMYHLTTIALLAWILLLSFSEVSSDFQAFSAGLRIKATTVYAWVPTNECFLCYEGADEEQLLKVAKYDPANPCRR